MVEFTSGSYLIVLGKNMSQLESNITTQKLTFLNKWSTLGTWNAVSGPLGKALFPNEDTQ